LDRSCELNSLMQVMDLSPIFETNGYRRRILGSSQPGIAVRKVWYVHCFKTDQLSVCGLCKTAKWIHFL
jgi:hypothetical protein